MASIRERLRSGLPYWVALPRGVAPAWQGADESAARATPPPGPIACGAAIALLVTGIVPPAVFLLWPAMSMPLDAPAVAPVLAVLLLLLPAASALAAARNGLPRLCRRFRAAPDSGFELAVLRPQIGTLIAAYAVGAAAAAPNDPAATASLAVAATGLVGAWGLLLHHILRPAFPLWRRHAATAFDAVWLAALLHFGGGTAAAWYPLCLVAIFYAGMRHGIAALWMASGPNFAGFAAVAATTPFWQKQPLLAGGLLLAVPAATVCTALTLQAIAAARTKATVAERNRERSLAMIGRALRRPLDAMVTAAPSQEASGSTAASALLAQVNDVLDLTAIEAGTFAAADAAFDLHALINDALPGRQREAARKGLRLVWRIDANLPYQLRGWHYPLAQIVGHSIDHAVETAARGIVRVSFDLAAADRQTVWLRLAVRRPLDDAAVPDPLMSQDDAALGQVPDGAAVGLVLVHRLVGLMGGSIAVERLPGGDICTAIVLPLAGEPTAAGSVLDLAGRPVLIVTEDSRLAGELAEPLNAWRADTRWIGGPDAALTYLARFETAERPVLIVDGREPLLPALSFVHRTPEAGGELPLILFVADPGQVGTLGELADGRFDGVLQASFTDALLRNALHALPLQERAVPAPRAVEPSVAELPPAPRPEAAMRVVPRPAVAEDAAVSSDRVTPIAAHPRYAAEPTDVVDPQAVESLRALGDGSAFLREVIVSFRGEAGRLLDRIALAAEATDPVAFARATQALHRCAGNLGGRRLCDLLLALRQVSADELREQGGAHVQRLGAELDRLETALGELAEALPGERRR